MEALGHRCSPKRVGQPVDQGGLSSSKAIWTMMQVQRKSIIELGYKNDEDICIPEK